MIDISDLVTRLRAAGSDDTSVEVKAAQGGLPASMATTLSALANLPGGGTIILGLDEATGFRPVPLADASSLKAGLASIGDRALEPPVRMTFDDAEVDGMPVIVVKVNECPPAQKPCTVKATGQAYQRGFDGDYTVSELERQAFLVARGHPDFDRAPVPETSRDDLDDALVEDWLRTVRERQPDGLGRFPDDDELLRRAGVTTTSGSAAGASLVLTVAGLLALGEHPQQHLPRMVISLASTPPPGSAVRARNATVLTGPIPSMLAGALDWARKTFDTVIVDSEGGVVREDYEYPLVAFRELISNALVHRDLAAWSRGFAIEVRHLSDRLIVTNPGGLFGVTVDRLGVEGTTSARNGQLVNICQYVRTTDNGGSTRSRVVEALATGIPTINASLAAAGMPPAQWVDTAIRFTAILRRTATASARKAPPVRTAAQVAVWNAIGQASRPLTLTEIQGITGLTESNLHKILRTLRDRDVIDLDGGQGKRSTYRRTRRPAGDAVGHLPT